jgi:ATP-dependent Clp protease ATP-binding subunit ClpB
MEKHSVARLIGAPPGYVGYDEGGYLTEAVRRKPYSVILLDEIEKAHSDVFNVLLQVLDDGRMTDGKGRTVDFKNTIMIMTSNLGSDLIMRMAEESADEDRIRNQIEEILHHQFKPEFLNRIDETIIFKSLSREDMASIVEIQLKRLAKRLEDQKLKLRFSQNAKKYLVSVGYNPLFGARPLKRAIRKHIEDPLAMEILENRFDEDSVILVDADADGITFTASKAERPEPEATVVEAELVE